MEKSQNKFIHLSLHTEFSIVDGIIPLQGLLAAAKKAGMWAVAITDLANLCAWVKFFKLALAQGIKPIIGSEVYIQHAQADISSRMIFLCQNNQGYANLTKLISRAYQENQINGMPFISKDWLNPEITQGILAISPGIYSEIGQDIIADKDDVEKGLSYWSELFPRRFYLGLHRLNLPNEDICNRRMISLAQNHALPVVAINLVCFLQEDDYTAHEARVCINQSVVLADESREKRYVPQQYFKSEQAMQELFADIPQAISNTNEIAKRCNAQLSFDRHWLPDFPTPNNVTLTEFFHQTSQTGFEKRVLDMAKHDYVLSAETKKIYQARLSEEIGIINEMGFAGYFLIVADFIQWAKDQGIPVGPGRGSGAGSLVAYSLGITDVDPLRYDLLFERFLNPERVSMPDFDIDFCMIGRDRVIDYVSEKYGKSSVSQIITFGTMAAKAVVRDVGRVLGFPYGFVDRLAKLVPNELGVTLKKALIQEEQLRAQYQEDDEVRNLINLSLKLEGICRNMGRHAGGVVIAPKPLVEFTPLYCEPDGSNLVAQYDKDDIEAIGLVKFDFLGLRTLTIIDWAVKFILHANPETKLNIAHISLTDKKTFKLLKSCNTTAVFQLESRGMQALVKRLQPDCFEEIVALVALFRPGPLQSGMVDDFVDRKHGRSSIEYPHPDLEPILKPTYGIILYQEQVMQIAQVLSGYTLGGADLLRRAMGKKKAEAMAKQRSIFIAGAEKNGVEAKLSGQIFDLIEKFAGYGFNKSHSVAYALISYQTAWLKANYPAEFMAAVLSSDMDNTDKVVLFVEDCKRNKLALVEPDINNSEYMFTVDEQQRIVYGLGAVKGVGQSMAEAIASDRVKLGVYKDMLDFAIRLHEHKVNKRALEALIKAGAMDSLQKSRAVLFASIEAVTQQKDQHYRNLACGQSDLFANTDSVAINTHCNYVCAVDWEDNKLLGYEKEVLGLYLSGHPIHRYQAELKKIGVTPAKKVAGLTAAKVNVAGYLLGVRAINTKQGKKIYIVCIEDMSGKVEFTLFSEEYTQYIDYLQGEGLIIAEIEVRIDRFSDRQRIRANKIFNIDDVRERRAPMLKLEISDQVSAKQVKQQLQALLKQHPGNSPVHIWFSSKIGSVGLELPKSWKVQVTDGLLDALKQMADIKLLGVAY